MWFYRSPEIVYGPDSLQFLDTMEIRKAVIVTDRNIVAAGLLDVVKEHLPEAELHIIDSIREEPSLEEIETASGTISGFEPEWVIGIGGGSSMDAAKLIFFRIARPDLDFFDLTPLTRLDLKKNLGLIAIPTTSGTGSECTWAAVITDSRDKRKAELASPEVIPDIAVLDPVMVQNLPYEVTRNTATDALTHALEAYVSTWSNPYSDALARQAVSMITEGISEVVKNPSDADARSKVHIGASMAGSAFSNSQIGLAHAMGHALGAVFGKPHGTSVGIFLPGVVKFNSEVSGRRYEELNVQFAKAIRGTGLRESVLNFLRLLERPTIVSELGIDAETFRKSYGRMVDLSFESTGIVGNPRDVRKQDIQDILEEINR